MDNSKIVFLINDTARCIKACYEPNAAPETFKTLDPHIAVGDLVVVQSGTRHSMTVAKVTHVDVDVDFDGSAPIKWIVQRIDTKGFDAVIASEAEAISAVQAAELRRKKAELRRTMFADHEDSIAKLALTARSIEGVTE